MPSRSLLSPNFNHPPPSFITKTRILFLTLIISASIVIIFTIFYILYHLWYSLVNRSRTIPFDSPTPLKLQRFCYKELKVATNDFSDGNIIGKGGSGTVFRGIARDGKLYAIKRLDTISLQSEREFQNELQILGGLRSPFLVTLLGYCVEKNKRLLIYDYMPNKSLQELLFGDGHLSLSWDTRFSIILDVARALEYLHLGCDPPVIHGDIKPSNVLLDFDLRAKISDFGLSRFKVEGDQFGVDLFSQDLGWKSQELSGNLTPVETAAIGTPADSCNEVDFALALQASSSSKNSRTCYNNVRFLNCNSLNYNANIACDNDAKLVLGNGKGKELLGSDVNRDDWNCKFVPYDDEPSSIDHSKELNFCTRAAVIDDSNGTKQWGKDWWWRQDGSGELCSKDYVMEWIGSQICPSMNTDWDDEKKSTPERTELNSSVPLDKEEDQFRVKEKESRCRKNRRIRKNRKMQEWWKEEHLDEISKKNTKLDRLETKWKKNFKAPHFHLSRRFHFHRRKKAGSEQQNQIESERNGEFSFRRGCKKKNLRSSGSDMWSGDLFSRELSSTTSMRGTLCYVAPEYGGCGYLMEKADIYSLGVLVLVIVSGRRPLHVLASPMKLEKANLISWCRHLAQGGNVLELVDERLKDNYNKEEASLCINLALNCLQKMPELRPDIGEIVKILKGDMDLPPLPFEFSPSPPSKLFSRSRRRHKSNEE